MGNIMIESTYASRAIAAVKQHARAIHDNNVLLYAMLDIVEYFTLLAKFADLGINITTKTKEEAFIQIIEMNDESLLQDLEKLIVAKDTIDLLNKDKHTYKQIISDIQSLPDQNDEESINALIKEFLKR